MLSWRRQLINLKIIIFIFVAVFLCGTAYAGWSEDMRLTHRGYENAPQIIARNDTIHVAWQQLAREHYVSYMRSIDGGINWDSLVNLTDYGHRGGNIDLSLSGDTVFMGWSDANTNLPNPMANIAYSVSSGGSVWPRPRYVHPDTMHNHPANDLGIIQRGDYIYITYRPPWDDSTGYTPIIFRYSSDMGQSWSEEVTVGHTWYYTNPLLIAKCGATLYIIWSGDCPPTNFYREVNGVVSHDGGQTWSEPFLVSSGDPYVAQHSCVACDEEAGILAVGWMDFALSDGFPGDIFVRLTTDDGLTWGDIRHATAHHGASDPSITIRGDSICAVWCDRDTNYGPLNSEICFSKSTDLGITWAQYERLTYAEGYSYTPWISYDLGKLHVVWWEGSRPPHGGDEIYYKRYDPDPIGINENISVPKSVSLSAYPNPFNSSVLINYLFQDVKGGDVIEGSTKLEIYSIEGQKIRIFHLDGKEGKINWDATDAEGNKVSSGIYFAKAMTPQEEKTIKLLLLK